MKRLIVIVSSIIINLNLMGQTNEFYTIESALKNKDKAISVYLNYNFQEISPITDYIGQLINLEELRIQPRWFDFPKFENKKIVSEKLDNSESKTPYSLPSEITNCKNLKLLDISNSEIKELPINFGQLENLEHLILNYSKIDLQVEIGKIVKLEKLKTLEIVGIKISNDQRKHLEIKSDLKILSVSEDYGTENKNDQTVDVQMHDTYMVFANEEKANRFINSMPFGLGKNAIKYKKAIDKKR